MSLIKLNEIGSEFWFEKTNGNHNNLDSEYLSFGSEQKFLFSGRTAIWYVLNDILSKKNIKSAYLPNYICDSVVQPFNDLNLEINYYSVKFIDGEVKYEIDKDIKADVFVSMSYFGFNATNMDSIIQAFQKSNIIVIEDITHRLFSNPNHSPAADYFIASLRKWMPLISGGLAIKKNGSFANIPLHKPPLKMIKQRREAMLLKRNYLLGNHTYNFEKNKFLALYKAANENLEDNYIGYEIDYESIETLKTYDIEKLIKKRKQNADFLLKNILTLSIIEPLINQFDYEQDCPLFVPVVVRDKLKNSLKNALIENGIYLPTHWPIKDTNDKELISLVNSELSLVCDQRYDFEEMKDIIKQIENFDEPSNK